MNKVLCRQRIVSAYAVSAGPRGAVSRLAGARSVSRQRIYREDAWVQQRLEKPCWQAERQKLRTENAALQARVAAVEKQARPRVLLDADKQAEFASVGQAVGVSLPVLRQLLRVLLGQQAPSVAKLGRLTQAAAARAGPLLTVLDAVAKPLARSGAVDEIYTKKPTLMVVEPDSMCWLVGQQSASASGAAWRQVFADLPNLALALRDAGTGLKSGIQQANADRSAHGQAPLAEQQDHFHSLYAGARGLGRTIRRAQAAYARAEKLENKYQRLRRHGHSLNGITRQKAAQWRKAEQAFDRWTEQERSWQQVKAALKLVTPAGDLNTPERAAQRVAEAMAALPEADFGPSKRQLQEPATYTYLREVQRQVAQLDVAAEVKDAAVKQACLRQRPELLQGDSAQAAALRGLLLVSMVVLTKAEAVGVQAARAIQGIFRSAWRASSPVECLNSVVRMQQARHRKLSQGLLDLKRLHWNVHEFRTGKRRHRSPYEHLGVHLPQGVTWWELLQWTPEQLRQQLSALQKAI